MTNTDDLAQALRECLQWGMSPGEWDLSRSHARAALEEYESTRAALASLAPAAVDATPVAWITQDDLRKLLAKEDNVIACAFFDGVQQNYVSLYAAAQVAALTAQCRWIRVSDELPPRATPVWVAVKLRRSKHLVKLASYWTKGPGHDSDEPGWDCDEEVMSWMPCNVPEFAAGNGEGV